MPWEKIRNLTKCCSETPQGFSQLYLLKNIDETHWLIGQYKDLTNFAASLRSNHKSREFLEFHRIRIGLRATDVPPTDIVRQERYGASVRGEKYDKDFIVQRLSPVALAVNEMKAQSINRKTDREQNVKNYWESQTPQSHHIVEFNNLETLGVSCKNGLAGMDYQQLPAVLLAAEFHLRYISAILKPTHAWGPERLEAEIVNCYSDLYLKRSKLFEPVWSVSKAILQRAGLIEN